MPAAITTPSTIASAPTFIGLQSYTEAQADKFFGRDAEIDNLTKLVETNTLTIVFGKSGTGKTSLLNAGVFPKLRKDYCLPFRIRLEFRDDSPDLVTQIKQVLKEEIDKYGFTVEAYPGAETLWEYFHREPLWNAVTPILVFDQFEEMFTLAKRNERFGAKEQAIFWEELADVIENSIPESLKEQVLNNKEQVAYNYRKQHAKIVFAFREEFLPEFESITAKIPSIKFSRFRLLPMNGNQAYDVVTKTWKENINDAEARQVVSFFTNDANHESYELLTVEPALLSQVCSFIDKERLAEGSGKVSAALLTKYPRETILRTIYEEALAESNRALNQAAPAMAGLPTNPVKEFIEDRLITSEGYRTKYHLGEKEIAIMPGLAILISRYLVREDDNKVELTHDILAPIIKTDREKRRKEMALTAERKRARKKAFIILIAAVLSGFGFWAFASYQRNKAIEDRDHAIEDMNHTLAQNAKLQQQLSLDSLKLKGIEQRIRKIEFVNGDSAVLRTSADSAELELLRQSFETISAELKARKEKLDAVNLEMEQVKSQLLQVNQASEVANQRAGTEVTNLRRRITTDSLALHQLKTELTALTIRFSNLQDLYQALMIKKYPPPPGVDTNFNLKMKLFYVSSRKSRVEAPGNLSIFLIPDVPANKNIIRQAKLYEIYCDENKLKKANNFQTATYHNGRYGFNRLPAGKYFVKICTYYGGYYSFTKKSDGVEELEWDAAPPIK